jgi:hypothetical protein
MVEVEMKQNADIRALCLSLAERCPSMKIKVTNWGSVKVSDGKAEFTDKPSAVEIDSQEIRWQRKELPKPIQELEAERIAWNMPKRKPALPIGKGKKVDPGAS